MAIKNTEISNDNMYKEVEKLILYAKDSKETSNKLIEIIQKTQENYRNEINDNLLMIAARKSMNLISHDILNYLLETKNYKEIAHINEDSENILMIFVKRNNVNLFNCIVENNNLKFMVNQKNKYGKSIFSLIKDYGRNEMLKILEENGMNSLNIAKQKII